MHTPLTRIGRATLYEVFDANFFASSNSVEKLCDSWVQTRGYQALRILHADTPTRLLSGSAHEAQTFLDNLWKPK